MDLGGRIIDELIQNNTLIFERFIGLNDVPGPNGIIRDVNEGIICRVNKINNILKNKTYIWNDYVSSYITFLSNFKMNAFGVGHYKFIDEYNIVAEFGNRIHYIKFNNDFTKFTSIRKDDLQIITGNILL